MKIYPITPFQQLIDLQPPLDGYEQFLGVHVFRGDRIALFDIGPMVGVPNLLAALAELGVKSEEIDYVILSHIHLDHAGGTGTALAKMVRARVVAHGRARNHLVDPTALWEASRGTLGQMALDYGRPEPVPADRIIAAADGMKIDLGKGLELEIYLTPGHASHHLSMFDRRRGVLIAGETAGVCVKGKIRLATPPPFKLEESLASLDRLISLEPRRLCYGHFGCYDDALPRLRLMRQKLLAWYEIVRDKAGMAPDELFHLLRGKDRDLDYLDTLAPGEYRREYSLILNSINGLLGAAVRSGKG